MPTTLRSIARERTRSRILPLCAAIWLGACGSAAPSFRKPDPRDTVAAVTSGLPAEVAAQTWAKADDVLQKRCIVCHGCYDAPCQLKLDSYAGIVRGATPVNVYESTRLRAAAPTRLGIDAHLVSEWRAKGFHPVLPEAPRPDPKASVLWRLLDQKRAHPLPVDIDFNQHFTFDLDRKASCVKAEDLAAYESEHPLWGMPYALPGLANAEHAALEAWIGAGAPYVQPPPLAAAITQSIRDWETYLNDPTPKRRLIARYLYEHLFLASLYFEAVDDTLFFRLVRSRTPPGFPVDEVPTRRPFEDPQGAFHYRIVHRDGARLVKTHMPYALSPARLARYQQLFDAPDFEVKELPSYELAVSSNPFRAFAALPVVSRYQFLLDEAEYFMMGFIKGPVCRGQVALNVIQERFWITFLDPDAPFSNRLAEQLSELQMRYELPAKAGSNALPIHWFAEAEQHARYVRKRNALWAEAQKQGTKLDVHLIWDGDGKNGNAGLTVLRHFDSATVVRGFVGGHSKTAWVVDYPMFERIHYLLVAGFDVFGNLGHQVMTRLYMDFLRMEGEANYLAFLPVAQRKAAAKWWYRGTSGDASKRVMAELAGSNIQPDVRYSSDNPEIEWDKLLEQHLAGVLERPYALDEGDPVTRDLKQLTELQGAAATHMPELSFVEVEVGPGDTRYFTIVRDSAHTNVEELFDEEDRRVPAEDQLRVVKGLLGAYPNALFHVPAGETREFVTQLSAVTTAEGYAGLRKRYGVLRGSPEFWSVSDRIHAFARKTQPLTAGSFDYNRLHAP